LYRRWGAREIQLQAAWDGLREGIWLRMGFEFQPEDRIYLDAWWRKVQADSGVPSGAEQGLPSRYEDWDDRLKEWLRNRPDDAAFAMYKRMP
jgi:hypothetical protein